MNSQAKKLHRRESNPGHKRERLVCYQLHHNGQLSKEKKETHQKELVEGGEKKDPTNRIRTSDLRKSITNYSPPLYQLSYGRYPRQRKKKVYKSGKTKNTKKKNIETVRTKKVID